MPVFLQCVLAADFVQDEGDGCVEPRVERRKPVKPMGATVQMHGLKVSIYSSCLISIEIWSILKSLVMGSCILKGRLFDWRKHTFCSLAKLFVYSMEWCSFATRTRFVVRGPTMSALFGLGNDSGDTLRRFYQSCMMEAMAILLFWENNDGSGTPLVGCNQPWKDWKRRKCWMRGCRCLWLVIYVTAKIYKISMIQTPSKLGSLKPC